MSQQGERPAAHEDDWWRRLYDESAPDTGASQAADSLDDRFDSVSGAMGPGDGEAYEAAPAVPEPRAAAPSVTRMADTLPGPPPDVLVRAPWEPPTGAGGPRTFAGPPAAPEPEPAPVPEPAPARAAEPAPPAPSLRAEPPADPRITPSAPAAPAAATPPLPRRPVGERPRTEPAATARPEAGPPAEPDPAAEAVVSRPEAAYVGARPPTYDAEPTALPATDPRDLHSLVADTVLDGARYGTYTLRAASVRGDSARFRGEPRRDALLTARFGAGESALVLVAVAGGARGAEGAHSAAADACRWIAEAVGRSHARLSDDIRTGRRGDLKSGLHRLTDRSYGKLRARAAELGLEPDAYTASLRCLLLSADPDCRTRVFFGIGGGGLFRLRDGSWQDLEPDLPPPAALSGEPVVGYGSSVPESGPDGERLTMDLGITTGPAPYIEDPLPPPAEPFRFRASVARPGDTLLLCSTGLAEPLRGEPALADALGERWAPAEAPGLGAFLADVGLRVTGYADDRTAVGVWEA
ncbi:protein phosphatase 2C domain-containing protein [Streptomyces sp. ITFR-16]|uniref:protein phosphatase 2C domain-containing protein n=1 Tax=Streptomyces sp. ITFR-16 TaxID=3075198 RepID=UPI00288B2DC3|nr:protein phosphatase 2C domain-containing protein [Streptomyces sp. ITFR-16]WNI21646.1 protein phosphatase 2C domain-containing protein [Streptomyces sp. ITFR-16]